MQDTDFTLLADYQRTGSQRSLARLVQKYQPSITRMAHRRASVSKVPVEDLIQIGNLALVEKLQTIKLADPGDSLWLLVSRAVRGAMTRGVDKEGRSCVSLDSSRAARKVFHSLGRTKKALWAAGVEVTTENIAQALDLPVPEVEVLRGLLEAPTTPMHVSGGALNRTIESVEDEAPSPYDLLEAKEMREGVRGAVDAFAKGLRPFDKAVLYSVLYDTDDSEQKQHGLAAEWGVTPARVTQAKKRLLKKMRASEPFIALREHLEN